MKQKPEPAPGLVVAAFAAIYLIWGSTYLAIVIGLQTLPPFLLAGIRFSLFGLLLLAWRLFRGERTDRSSVLKNSFAGVLMSGVGTGAVIWVEQYIASGLAAIIVASLPFWFVVLDFPHWRENFSQKLVLLGVAVGFAGVLMLVGGKSSSPNLLTDVSQPTAILVLLFGCVCWAGGSLFLKNNPSPGSTLMNVSFQGLAPGVLCLLISLFSGELEGFSFGQVSGESWLGLGYLIFFGSLLGYVSYVWLLAIRPPVLVGTYAYVNPVVAVLLGWAFAGERLDGGQVWGLLVILLGVLLINFEKYRGAAKV